MRKRIYKAITLYSGAGGSSMGLHFAGYRERLAVDCEPHSVATLRLNGYVEEVWEEFIDSNMGKKILSKLALKPKQVDLLVMTPPCQQASAANTSKKVKWENVNGFTDCVQILMDVQPLVFIIENVPGLTYKSRRYIFNPFLIKLRQSGYTYDFCIMTASNHGVPQKRKRFIMVGIHPDLAAIGLKPVFPVVDPPIDFGLINFAPGITHFSMGQHGDKKIDARRICHTITKTQGMKLHYPDGSARRPSIELLKTLFTFPEDFKFADFKPAGKPPKQNYLQNYARLGNSVPVEFMRRIAETIKTDILNPFYDHQDSLSSPPKQNDI